MVKAFLRSVAEHIHEHYKDKLESVCIVLPNKRASLFLKKHLAVVFGKTIWLPAIISAEELIEDLSGLKVLEEIDLTCHLYESYKACYGESAESFDSFAKWGHLILQDFNEIDRYLADPKQLYENLKDIKVIENWSLNAETLTEHQTAYLKFMGSLGSIYRHYSSFLLSNGWAYQGLAYRQAWNNHQKKNYGEQFSKIVFCGFNALNAAELNIFGSLKQSGRAEMLWDADRYYFDDNNQEAGMFLRRNFEIFKQKDPQFIASNLQQNKQIRIVSVPKQIGQAQVIRQSLQRLMDQGISMDKVAVVLANEKLLWPVIQQLPKGIDALNVTMEYPLRYTAAYEMAESLINLQLNFERQNRQHKTIYFRDLSGILRHPLFRSLGLALNPGFNPTRAENEIRDRNISFVSQKDLDQLLQIQNESLRAVFTPVPASQLCNLLESNFQVLLSYLEQGSSSNQKSLELEYLHLLCRNLNRVKQLMLTYPHFNSIQNFKHLFQQVLGNTTVPFIGEPLRGLQVMGVLETRTLDFEHLLIVNVNEGILPSGKTISSFIPNDLKRAFGLPLYVEKDAIYAYHFYRLLQRADNIIITYDSETDTFGKGEKSRFVTQLLLELREKGENIQLSEEVAVYPEFPGETGNIISVEKNNEVLRPIALKAAKSGEYGGLSPSSLLAFKECPLRFYFRYGARLKELTDVEENAEANTFGSILHLALEKLYQDLLSVPLTDQILSNKLSHIPAVVEQSFISFFDNRPAVGKNLLQLEVIKEYVKKLLGQDQRLVSELEKRKQNLVVNGLEKEFQYPIEVKVSGDILRHYIKGKIDRVDTFEGRTRVIDYKSSVKESDKFGFEGFEVLFSDKNYNKQLQLFIYAWLVWRNAVCKPQDVMACVLPFKVFSEQPLYVTGADKKPLKFTEALLTEFEIELSDFISSIFDPGQPFFQTDDENAHQYCPYNNICNLS